MKKLTFLKLALITALTCVIVTSCGKDDGDVTPPGQTEFEKETGMRLTGVGDYRFNYDDKGRCAGMDYLEGPGSSHITIDWDKSEIRTSEGYEHPLDAIPIKFMTNGRGYITELSQSWDYELSGESYKGNDKATLSYDNAGHLIQASFRSEETGIKRGESFTSKSESDYTLTWESGNLVLAKYIADDFQNNKHEKEEYDYEISYNRSSHNRYKQWTEGLEYVFEHDIFILCHVGLFGVGTANFPTNIHEYGDYEDDYSVRVSTYSSGLISSEKFDGETYDYTYDEVGTRSKSFDSSLPTKTKKRPLRHHRKMWK